MTAHSHDTTVPRGALIAAAALVGMSLSVVVAVQSGWMAHAADPVAKRETARAMPLKSRDLVFVDTATGAVGARDARTGVMMTAVKAGQETGFIRGVMRGLARDRHLRGIGPEAPFRVTRWSNGDLTLTDTATARTIELNSFGATNQASFEALL